MSDEALAIGVRTQRPRRTLLDSERLLAIGGLTPAVIYIVALVGFPFVLAVVMAFSDVTVGDPSLDLVGLETLRQVLADPVFWRALRNTLVFTLISVHGNVNTGVAQVVGDANISHRHHG